MHTVVLVEPKIPQNTGTIARLCAATNSRLILVGELGFSLDDKYLKRAGLDYWEHVNMTQISTVDEFLDRVNVECHRNLPYFLSSKVTQLYTDVHYTADQWLVFGSETLGLSEDIKSTYSDRCVTIPMVNSKIRSLNLANSVSIVLYEAIRQQSQ